MSDLVYVNKVGLTQSTVVEDEVEANFRGESSEVGLYLAMSRQAQREGYPEIAEVLKTIAWEEAAHAARYAELNGKISGSTKENLVKMLSGEQGANKGKYEAGIKAKTAGLDEASSVFTESSADEARHANMLAGLIKRYFGE